jgi:hypothetical protein
MANKQYGWTYNKSGNKVTINPPITASGKVARRHSKTKTGKIPDSVGFSGFKS